jgi:hypothetical protein
MDAEEWTALFDRAAAYGTDEAAVAAALAEIRDARAAGDGDGDGTDGGTDDGAGADG